MMSRIDAHAMAKNTFEENFSVQKCLTIIFGEGNKRGAVRRTQCGFDVCGFSMSFFGL